MATLARQLTFAEKANGFYSAIKPPQNLLRGVSAINPHASLKVVGYTKKFFNKYFNDGRKRIFVFGINPGRFGSGTTGVPFTDSVALEDFCGIKNIIEKRRELSSGFIYKFIEHYGGARAFYKNFFLTAVSPIGFVRANVNYNYYDDPKLLSAVRPYIVGAIKDQINFGAHENAAIVLGTGKNRQNFMELNAEYGFFKKVYALEHPRYIMQYKRKSINKYLAKYKKVFSEALKAN